MKLLLKRLAQLIGFLALVLVLAVAALHWYQPKVPLVVLPPPKPISGAAVFYNQAFASMPELSAEDKKLLKIKPSEPMDMEAAKQLVTKCDTSLQLVAQGTMQPQCEWGLNLSLGPAMPGTHFSKGLELAKLLAVRARLHFAERNGLAATDDLLLMFRFARHLSEPALIIGNLVKISTDACAINLAAHFLQDFDLISLQRLSEGISTLPPSHSMQEAMALDSKTFVAYLCNLLAPKYAREAQQSSHQSSKEEAYHQDEETLAKSIIAASPTLYLFTVHKYKQKSHELEKLMGMPYVEARSNIEAFEKNLKKEPLQKPFLDIWSCLALPSIVPTRLKEVQTEAAWTVLRTALDAQIHNPSSVCGELAKLRDPYDGGPIEMRDVPGGVELKLKSEPYRKPMTLMVGLAGK